MDKKHSRPVYSTESGRLCPGCGQPVSECRCRQNRQQQVVSSARSVTVQRERKGRAGKEVTVVRDLPLNQLELQLLASSLKKHCGCGGTVTQDTIEIQGDQRERIRRYLSDQGYQVKLAGG
ncbi:MAG: hypothetical protein R3F41_01250 [Gammaproteobacteria bacterium]|nr:stress response translation initiation inhibitor YciH [Pseudomonadales bacterium]MCP5346071.1 hypothetical protein [Pseudomonadales bacterium]